MPDDVKLTAAQERELAAACNAALIDDIPKAFAALKPEGSKLEIYTRGAFPDRYAYTKTRRNGGGNENHFQGCQRVVGHHIAISGGDWRNEASHLFVGRLASRGRRKRWGTNIGDDGPPSNDKVISRVDLDSEMWHAGGIAACGSIVAVPVECGGEKDLIKRVRARIKIECKTPKSRAYFVDIADPANPRVLSEHVHRAGRKATAVALVRIPGQGYVLGVLSSDKTDDKYLGKKLEFYRSRTEKISDGFITPPMPFRVPTTLQWDDYQTINFAREKTGALYLFGMTGKIVDLFEITLPDPGPPRVAANVWFNARREFELDKRFAEFKAGIGVYIEDNGLALYAVPQWRRGNGKLGLTEWVS